MLFNYPKHQLASALMVCGMDKISFSVTCSTCGEKLAVDGVDHGTKDGELTDHYLRVAPCSNCTNQRFPDPLPCPFCGGDDIAWENFCKGLSEQWGIVCNTCGVRMENFTSESELLHAWNKRIS